MFFGWSSGVELVGCLWLVCSCVLVVCCDLLVDYFRWDILIDGQRFVDRQWRIVVCWCLCEFCCWWVGFVGVAFAFGFDLSAFDFVQVIVGPFVSIVWSCVFRWVFGRPVDRQWYMNWTVAVITICLLKSFAFSVVVYSFVFVSPHLKYLIIVGVVAGKCWGLFAVMFVNFHIKSLLPFLFAK